MAVHVALHHLTRYQYDRPVNLSPQVIRLRPAPHCRTPILSYSLTVRPKPHFLNRQQDPQGNLLARVVFPEKVTDFEVEVDLTTDMTVVNPFDFFLEPDAEKFPFVYEDDLAAELMPFRVPVELGEAGRAFLDDVNRTERSIISFLVDLNQQVKSAVEYVVRMEPGVQTPNETLTRKRGSCRDSAWLLVGLLRELGLAARFASGYLIQLTADMPSLDGPSGPAADFCDLHAWAEVFLPGAGWVGLDATSGLLAGEGHIPLACAPFPTGAAPVTGSVDPCETKFSHDMSVLRVREDPRVTKPYDEKTWEEINALGEQVDARLSQGDVRLSMGGEPTFVSLDDKDGLEWNTEALGPTKKAMAFTLLKGLKAQWAEGGLLHTGQGKWYPGEPLPRWALSCFRRKDGVPLWRNPSLLADADAHYDADVETAEQFIATLADTLGIAKNCISTGYEDVFYYLWREKSLPVNVDPFDAKLEDPIERERLARVFSQGLGTPTGFALPLSPTASRSDEIAWLSEAWQFRGGRMLLVPGDSPMGLRLPIDGLPHLEPEHRTTLFEQDPLQPQRPLPARARKSTEPSSAHTAKESSLPVDFGTAFAVRTALCCEPRNGALHVFLPPLPCVEDFIRLLEAIEETAESLGTPVVIEGYPPPNDPRISQLKITPDPGVIEVNLPPADDWRTFVERTHTLYETARLSRLVTERFDLDGKHTGTGGGNHVVLGGPTPADSPFLRRPDLLRSFIGVWHNHPSLSYLFSGRFVGPTSQAPRVDEGRQDAIYELEIAFQRTPEGQGAPPWLVDRLYRHLLVDGTGNTHRAELCIDKLYSPDTASGRQGLVEFRAFEMPPHAAMSAAAQLTVRALTAAFWEKPYDEPLIRWNTRIHDRLLLPHFVKQDFEGVLNLLRSAGFDFKDSHFAPHFEFRFPLIGETEVRGIHLELREAIEPWYVLGEEPGGGGTSRYVDSSVERLQVKVEGHIPERYAITCNGRVVPLYPTGTNGQFAAGVRYRAWQPPHCLHPTIPVDAPLVFDVVDLSAGRSLGGCTYHVAHPGGRNFDTFPVNANEAEARRAARFFRIGHSPGPLSSLPDELQNPEFPVTLDLRRLPIFLDRRKPNKKV